MASNYRDEKIARRIEMAVNGPTKPKKKRKPKAGMLGSGAASSAARKLSGRKSKLDKLLDSM